jgi:hypothetical protein
MHKKHIEMSVEEIDMLKLYRIYCVLYKLQNELKKDKHEYFYRMINP